MKCHDHLSEIHGIDIKRQHTFLAALQLYFSSLQLHCCLGYELVECSPCEEVSPEQFSTYKHVSTEFMTNILP